MIKYILNVVSCMWCIAVFKFHMMVGWNFSGMFFFLGGIASWLITVKEIVRGGNV